MKRTKQTPQAFDNDPLRQKVVLLAEGALRDNPEPTFRIVSEDATMLADALRLLGCRVKQGLFRMNELQVTPLHTSSERMHKSNN